MDKKILTIGNTEIEKNKYYQYKSLFPLRDVDIEKVSSKIYFSERNYKYFIGNLYNDHKVKLLHITLPKTSAYVESYDGQTKWMYLFD